MIYFGDDMEHSTCSLGFTLAVGAQGHTETWPALLRAANRGDLKAARRALDPLDATAGRYGHSALHRAALHGYPQVVKHLLKARAQVGQRDSEGLTPIFMAAFSGHVEVASGGFLGLSPGAGSLGAPRSSAPEGWQRCHSAAVGGDPRPCGRGAIPAG